MKNRGWSKIGFIFILSLILLLFASFIAKAEEAKYIYDDVGRLYQVIDEQGNVATYNYDAVGNLLSITRTTGGLPAPMVTGISPNSARAGDTVQVTISGNYLLNAGVSTDNPAIGVSNVQITQTSIKAIFSISWFARQGLTKVAVANALGSATIGFTVNPPPPAINALSPNSGPVTRLVEINGTAFSDIPSGNVVRFNGVMALVYSCTPIKILTSVPFGATTGPVTVTTNNGISNGVNFTVASASGPPPTIISITPNIGSVEGGEKVIISGGGFTYDSQALICQKAVAGVTVVNGSTLSIVTAPGVAGVCDVQVGNLNGDALLPGGFTYLLGPPQRIVNINPPMGSANIPINALIAALFIRPVDRATINSAGFSLAESNTAAVVPGTFSYDFDDKIVNFAPQSPLKPNTAYTLNISTSVKSADGIPLDQAFSSSFTTSGSVDTASPTVAVSPADQATGIPINAKIVFIFSKQMNPTSLNFSTIMVNNNEMPVQGNITFNSTNTVATFVPSSNFLPNSFVNVALSKSVTDMAGNRIVGSGGVGTFFTSSFTTADTIDNTPPSVVSIDPPNGATGIDPHTSISVTFGEPINPVTVNADTFTIFVDDIRYTGRISFSNQNNTATFKPDQSFPYVSQVTATLTTGIADVAGNATVTPFNSIFTTIESVHLTVGYSGPTTLTIGDTIKIEVANAGGVDTTSIYTVKLSDMSNAVVYQNLINDMIQAGTSKNYSFQIPPQAANGFYDLYSEVVDSRGIKKVSIHRILIVGLNAALSTRTEKDVYLPEESVRGTSTIANGLFAVEGGALKTTVRRRVPSVSGNFSHLLPKKGWWPFYGPEAVAIGPDHSIYVAGNNMVQKFDADGKFITKWGNPGSGDGEFDSPNGIAVAPDGSVYVTDLGNHRVQKFDSSGNFVSKWGNYGTANGQLDRPYGIAVGPDGSVYVAEYFNDRVQKFDANGNFIAKWGSYGSGNGQFDSPSGIAVGADGSVYVADTWNDRIQKFGTDGSFITKWGVRGSELGQFGAPHGIAVSPDASVFVVDTGNHRIQKFNSNGKFISMWGINGIGDREFASPNGIAVDTDGSVYVADTDNYRIQNFDSDGDFVSKLGIYGNDDGEFQYLYAIAVGPDGSVYTTDPSSCRIQKFDSNGNFVTKWGSRGDGDGQFYEAYGIAVGPDGSVYVGDWQGRIEKFDGNGNFIAKFGSRGSGDGEIDIPMAIAVGPDGSVYVADPYNYRVDKFDGQGNFVTKWGTQCRSDINGDGIPESPCHGGFLAPEGISIGPDGSVYVSDAQNNCIQKFDSSGNFIAKWGGPVSNKDGQFSQPGGVTVGPDGFVYVSDLGNNRIQKFDENGNFITKWGNYGMADGQFYYPAGVALGPDGSVYVAERNNRIQRMEPITETLFETIVPVIQPANSSQDYLTNIGALNSVGKFYLQATLLNSFGQTIALSRYSFSQGSPEQIIRVSPAMGMANVPVNTLVTVLFTMPVDRMTVNSTSFSLVETSTGAQVAGHLSFDLNDAVVTFTPNAYLKANTSYTLNITRDVRSTDGIPLDQPLSSSFATAGLVDTVFPTVTVSPEDSATEVPVNTLIVFSFSESINPTSINPSTITVSNNGTSVLGSITLANQNTFAIFSPTASFLPNSLVSITLSHRVADMAGNPIVGSTGVGTDFVSSFTTASTPDNVPPQVLSITPADGATGVDRNTVVSVTFSEPINAATVNADTFTLSAGGVIQSGMISFSGQNTVATFTPDQALPPLTPVTVTLLPGISDRAGNSTTSTFTSSFTTGGKPRLTIIYSGPTTLTLGDTINVQAANIGDSDTSSTYTVKLSDKNGVAIYQNTIFDTIQAGRSKTYSFQIPNQAAGSDYTLYAEVTDSRSTKTTNSFGIKIIGLNASLGTRTDKDIYLPTDSITGTSTILDGPFGIEGGSLNVSVSKIGRSTTGQFNHFLPKRGWLSLNYPYGVAVGPDGSVYVADTENHRIQKVDINGHLTKKWGSEGSGDGQFEYPGGVSVASDGSVYIADTSNHRIQKFDSNGNFTTKWGSEGSGDGQFEYPVSISVASDGSVYVADIGNNRIEKFDSNGSFIMKWGSYCTTDPNEDGVPELPCDGQFNNPAAIAVGSDGFVYVADGNQRIQKFDTSGNFITKWGSAGSGDGEFGQLEGVAIGPDGSIFVSDMGNHRIQKFDSNGSFITKWGSYCTTDPNEDGVQEQPCDGQFYCPSGIAVSSEGSVYVADTNNNRIQKFDGNGNFLTQWSGRSTGSGDGEFSQPEGVEVGSDGSIYVVDTGNHRIQRFGSGGNFITKWGGFGTGDGQFDTPRSIAIGPDGSVYVADTNNNRIQRFDSNGNFVMKWGKAGDGDGEFWGPQVVAVGSDGSVYVPDTYGYNNRVQKFDSSGNFIAKWYVVPEWNSAYLTGLAIGLDGSVYVTDWSSAMKFDSAGNFITSWGIYGRCEGECWPRFGIAVGPDGSVYVSNTINHPIQKFDGDGNLLAEWGSYGSDDGQFDYPWGIAVAPGGSIYVADTSNYRIQKMEIADVVEKIFETALPINEPASTTRDYTTNIGALNVTGKLYLQATLMNSLGQTVTQSSSPFYIIEGDTVLIFNTDKKSYAPGETVVITGQVQNRGTTDLANLVLSFSSKYLNQGSQVLYTETFDLLAGGNHPFTVTTSAGAAGTVLLTGTVSRNNAALIEIQDQYEVINP